MEISVVGQFFSSAWFPWIWPLSRCFLGIPMPSVYEHDS
jgi:hypothetical protein